MTDADRMTDRKIGVRVGFVATAVACYLGTLLVLGQLDGLDQPEAWSSLEWLIGTIAVAVLGDTLRPSGRLTPALRLSRADQHERSAKGDS